MSWKVYMARLPLTLLTESMRWVCFLSVTQRVRALYSIEGVTATEQCSIPSPVMRRESSAKQRLPRRQSMASQPMSGMRRRKSRPCSSSRPRPSSRRAALFIQMAR